MAIARRVGGFSPAQADDLRKAISKKNHQLMATLEGIRSWRGSPTRACRRPWPARLWANFEATGDYSFNKSHAACYAMISYRTAWLKANYPVEYMAALVSSVMNTKDKVPFYVNQCREMGIEVLPPDVNTSDVEFTVVEGRIRFGMNAVKGVGVGAIEAIIRSRAEGKLVASVFDFCARVDSQMANKRVLEALVRAGAFDSTGDPRRGMLEVLPLAMSDGERKRKDAANGQGDLFGGMATDAEGGHPPPTVPRTEWDQTTLLRFEKEALGLYVSAHPLQGLREQLHDEIEVPVTRLNGTVTGRSPGPAASSPTPRRRSPHAGGVWLRSPRGHRRRHRVPAPGPRSTSSSGSSSSRTPSSRSRGRIERRAEGDLTLGAIEVVPFNGVSEYHPLTVVIDSSCVAPRSWTTCAGCSPTSPARCRWCCRW